MGPNPASPGSERAHQSGEHDRRAVCEAAFLEQLGQRVRRIRGQRGLSRKALAQFAGVSERYLAQLESGQGNISILLLRRIGDALERRLEDLVAEGGDDCADIAGILRMLRRATPEERRRAKAAIAGLQPDRAVRSRAGRFALIGLRGAGKSTLGKQVAADLALPFVELNDEIARASGLNVAEIFNLYGPEGYRRLERRCLQQVIDSRTAVVLASGGGIVSDPATYDLLLSAFFTVWLRASPEEHMARVRAQGDLRPMAGNSEAMEDLRLILSSREGLYARADRQLDTAGRSEEDCRRSLAELLSRDAWVASASGPSSVKTAGA